MPISRRSHNHPVHPPGYVDQYPSEVPIEQSMMTPTPVPGDLVGPSGPPVIGIVGFASAATPTARPPSDLADTFRKSFEEAERAIALRELEAKDTLKRWRSETARRLRALADELDGGAL